eukprot:TRINITY_DN8915_c0_g1_i2.p1 TRINITY_DN8915_c0_g1~~TRINITY_DN8915_c0_g1_i2.p1  ORF type:complete len:317 (-),score=132.52 TRINITY_DN8915_c0_g1_i2:20-892(-)
MSSAAAAQMAVESSQTSTLSAPVVLPQASDESTLTPSRVVEYLDAHIVGQKDAKRAIAVALRSRWRRRNAEPEFLRDEISPKNMLMVGPTGVGKTELARRIAKLVNAPFVKVEATKFTEVGYHGRDVDTIVRDLVANALTIAKTRLRAELAATIESDVEQQLCQLLSGKARGDSEALAFLPHLRAGELDDSLVALPIKDPLNNPAGAGVTSGQTTFIAIEAFVQPRGGSERTEKVTVREARERLRESELSKRIDDDVIKASALRAAECDGIVFIDIGDVLQGADLKKFIL